jgi:hypothetical protein
MDPTNPLATCTQYTTQQLSRMFQGADNAHAISRTAFQKAAHALVNVPSQEQQDAFMKQLTDMIQLGEMADAMFAMTQVCQRVKEGLQMPSAKLPSIAPSK